MSARHYQCIDYTPSAQNFLLKQNDAPHEVFHLKFFSLSQRSFKYLIRTQTKLYFQAKNYSIERKPDCSRLIIQTVFSCFHIAHLRFLYKLLVFHESNYQDQLWLDPILIKFNLY